MNKNNGILFLALAALGYGAYLMFGNRKVSTVPTGSTGTAKLAPYGSFADSVGVKGGAGLPRGAQSGASIDLSGAATAGVNALATLAKRALDLFSGGNTSGTSPGTTGTTETPGYGGVGSYGGPGSEGGGFVGPVWELPSSVEYGTGSYGDWDNTYEGYEPPATDTYNEPEYGGDTYSYSGDDWI